jgi:arsenite methyltransferase
MNTADQGAVRKAVRENYGRIAVSVRQSGCCSGSSCCGSPEQDVREAAAARTISGKLGYSEADIEAVPPGADMGLGCGNPLAYAAIQPGETVLDLGSGGGFDAFLASPQTGAAGLVLGVDMTPEMVEKARKNEEAGGYGNVEFRLGEIENLPLANDMVDVIISNCVINLSPDKQRVFSEAFRVLKPGGRLAISDTAAMSEIPAAVKADLALHAGCIAGAVSAAEIEELLSSAGFTEISVTPKYESQEFISEWVPGSDVTDFIISVTIQAEKPKRA